MLGRSRGGQDVLHLFKEGFLNSHNEGSMHRLGRSLGVSEINKRRMSRGWLLIGVY